MNSRKQLAVGTNQEVLNSQEFKSYVNQLEFKYKFGGKKDFKSQCK